MDGLLKWIEAEEPLRGFDGCCRRARRTLVGEQPREAAQGQLAQPPALGEEPVLERGLLHREALEKVARIEGKTLGQRRRGRLRHPLHERPDVHAHGGGVQSDGVRVDLERLGISAAQALPDRIERLAEAHAGGRLDGAPPEEARQLVAGVGHAGRHGEVGEEGLRLSRGQAERRRSDA